MTTKKLITAACVVSLMGCSSTYKAYKTYDGMELPLAEIATVHNSSHYAFWSFTDIVSVDGMLIKQPANAIAALPGTHWYQVAVTRRSILAMLLLKDGFYHEAICGFMLQAAPGATYTLGVVENGGLASTNEHKVYIASLGIEETFANGASVIRQIPTECTNLDLIERGWFERLNPRVSKKYLCQDKLDCQVEGTVCIKEAGYSYGVCGNP